MDGIVELIPPLFDFRSDDIVDGVEGLIGSP